MRPEIDSAEIDSLYDYVARAFAEAFCFVTVEHDFEKRQRYVAAAQDASWTYRDTPAYDPKYNALAGSGFWLNVRRHGSRSDGAQDMVANCAVKVWRKANLSELFADNRFFQERDSGFTVAFDCAETPHVDGTLAYVGGAWVHPDFRSRGIAAMLMAFAQLHLIEHYDADYTLGLIDDKAAQAGMGARAWRFHHHHSGISVHWPGLGTFPGWLIYNTRADMIQELRRFAATPIPEREVDVIRASA
jgi:ribosomal protein S18 acetylase RimI-like enzyme